jgi:hypothetical protein
MYLDTLGFMTHNKPSQLTYYFDHFRPVLALILPYRGQIPESTLGFKNFQGFRSFSEALILLRLYVCASISVITVVP